MSNSTFAMMAISAVSIILTLLWRWNSIERILKTQKHKIQEIWIRQIDEQFLRHEIHKSQYDLDAIRADFDSYVDSTLRVVRREYDVRVFFSPYILMLIIWSIVGVAIAVFEGVSLGDYLTIVSVYTFPLLIIQILYDSLFLIHPVLKRWAFLEDKRGATLYGVLFVILVGGVFELFTDAFTSLSVLLSGAMGVVIVVIIALRQFGITSWGVTQKYLTDLRQDCAKRAEAIRIVMSLQQTLKPVKDTIKRIADDYLNYTDEDTEELLSMARKRLEEGQRLIKGEIESREEREAVLTNLDEIADYEVIDLKGWWIDRHLKLVMTRAKGDAKIEKQQKALKEVGVDSLETLQVACALLDDDYWTYSQHTITKLLSNSEAVQFATSPIIRQNYRVENFDFEINLLASVASRIAETVPPDSARLSGLFDDIRRLFPFVRELSNLIKHAEVFCDEEDFDFELIDEYSALSSSLKDLVYRKATWNDLSNVFTHIVQSRVDSHLMAADYSGDRVLIISRNQAIKNILSQEKEITDLQVLYRRFLDQLAVSRPNHPSGLNLELSRTLVSCFDSDTTLEEIENSFDLCNAIGDHAGQFYKRMQARFVPTTSSTISFRGTKPLKEDGLDRIIAFLAIHGEMLFEADLISSLAEATICVEPANRWVADTRLLRNTLSKMKDEDKKQFISVLLLELVEGIHEGLVTQIPNPTQHFIDSITLAVIRRAESEGLLYSTLETSKRAITILSEFERRTGLGNDSTQPAAIWKHAVSSFLVDERSAAILEATLASDAPIPLAVLSFSIATSQSSERILELVQKIRTYDGQDESSYALMRYWYASLLSITSAKERASLIHETFIMMMNSRTSADFSGKEYVDKILKSVTAEIIERMALVMVSPNEQEKEYAMKGEYRSLYDSTQSSIDQIQSRLNLLHKLMNEGSRIIDFAASYYLLDSADCANISLNALQKTVDWTNSSIDINSVTLETVNSVFLKACEGNDDPSYIVALIALITNTLFSMGWGTVDKAARETLLHSDDALRWIHVFAIDSNNGENVLMLPYSQLEKTMDKRKKLIEEDPDTDTETIQNLRGTIAEGGVWKLKLRALSKDEEKERKLQIEVQEFKQKYYSERDSRIEAEQVIKTVFLEGKIMDSGVYEYLSARSYNYFLLSWDPNPGGNREAALKEIIQDWFENDPELLGFPFRLGASARVGKIPRGYSFEEFSELAVKEIETRALDEGIEPLFFLVKWAPTIHSARALSNSGSLNYNAIEGFKIMFENTTRKDEVVKFIEKSVIGELSFDEAIMALNQSSESLYDIWNRNLLNLSVNQWLTAKEKTFMDRWRYELKAILGLMLNHRGGLMSAAELTLQNYEELAKKYSKEIFQSKWKKAADASNIIVKILNKLRTVFRVADFKEKH